MSLSRLLMFAAAVMFLLACLAAAGASLGDVRAWVWGFAGFCAYCLAGAL